MSNYNVDCHVPKCAKGNFATGFSTLIMHITSTDRKELAVSWEPHSALSLKLCIHIAVLALKNKEKC